VGGAAFAFLLESFNRLRVVMPMPHCVVLDRHIEFVTHEADVALHRFFASPPAARPATGNSDSYLVSRSSGWRVFPVRSEEEQDFRMGGTSR
jgi:hypothetical protein